MAGIYAKRNKLFREPATGTIKELSFLPSAQKLVRLTGNVVVSRLTGGDEGERLLLILQQDGTGSRLVTWPSEVVWVGGAAPTLAITAHHTNQVELIKVADKYFARSLGAAAATAAL
jgi:hypothetical protein